MMDDQKLLIPSSKIQLEQKAKSGANQNKAGKLLFCLSFGYIGHGIGCAISHAIVLSLSFHWCILSCHWSCAQEEAHSFVGQTKGCAKGQVQYLYSWPCSSICSGGQWYKRTAGANGREWQRAARNNVTKSMEADSTNKPPEPTIESDKGQLGTNVTKSLNPYRSDDDVGDLDWRFSVNNGRLAMDEEVCHLNT